MNMSSRLAVSMALSALLIAPTTVQAAGSAFISGNAVRDQLTWYYSERYVNDPSLPGAEVAFKKSTGPSGLFLGTHNCDQTGGGPFYQQVNGSWQPVRYYSQPQWFCMLTVSNSGTGSFSGTLAWD